MKLRTMGELAVGGAILLYGLNGCVRDKVNNYISAKIFGNTPEVRSTLPQTSLGSNGSNSKNSLWDLVGLGSSNVDPRLLRPDGTVMGPWNYHGNSWPFDLFPIVDANGNPTENYPYFVKYQNRQSRGGPQ